jgi:hypothetical protein
VPGSAEISPSEAGGGANHVRIAMSEDTVTITLPRCVVEQISSPSAALLDRMHELLERNAEGYLAPIEREELETLVMLVQFSQIILAMLARAGQA